MESEAELGAVAMMDFPGVLAELEDAMVIMVACSAVWVERLAEEGRKVGWWVGSREGS